MANPTTNYGFVLPTATDLVTDLPADFDVALQGVDTRLKALQPGTTLGDLFYASATANTNTRLGIGTAGQVLSVTSGVPAWTTTSDVTPLTTKGDLFTFTTVDARIGIGANNTVLTADSAEATGLKWATPSSGSMTLLSTTALTGSSVTVSSISGAYIDLKIFITGYYASSNATMRWRINGVTSSSYVLASAGAVDQTASTETSGQWIQDVKNAANANNSTNFEIKNYTNTEADKQVYIQGYTNNPNGANYVSYSNWNSLVKGTSGSAVSSFTVFPDAGTFSAGTIYIYGVK